MGNIWFILRRDLKRLIRVPAAWVTLFGLVVIPCLYAWFNIAGFWNPYENTQHIKVAVANEDTGADSALLGKLDLGQQLVDKLKENHQLGWTFLNKSEAMQCVESGDCYAAIVIPKDFSQDMASVITDSQNRPQLDYYVNEKVNAVAPKITDVGATTVDRQVNSTFVSTASSVISDIVNKANISIDEQSNATVDKTRAQLTKTKNNLEKTQTLIDDLQKTLKDTKTKTQDAKDALAQVDSAAKSAGTGLNQASDLLTQTQQNFNTFLANSSKQFDQGSALYLKASNQMQTDATNIANGVLAANGATAGALNELKSINQTNAQILSDLQAVDISDLSPTLNQQYQALISQLKTNNEQTSAAITTATNLNDATQKTAQSSLDTITQFGNTSNTTLGAITDARNTITTGALPKLNAGLSSLASTSGALGASASSQTQLVAQTNIVLDQLAGLCDSASSTLDSTSDLLDTFVSKLDQVGTDLGTLASANILQDLLGSDGTLDATRIANFMLSPTVLDTHTLYPINSYGSGMAPLFTSLALWVGAFMLMVLMRLEVDDEGLEGRNVTMNQTYIARFLLLAILAILQGLTCSIGDLIIGVQSANRFVFILTAIFASLTYLSIAYALSTTFMHVGKALVVVLVMVQIPGASGLYPIEMMPRFYRILYPFFPFTYTIDAFREAIAGFYDHRWIKMVLMLLVFVIASFFLGLVIRPLMSNLNHLFAREIHESDMIVGEQVYTPTHRFNLMQVLQALTNQGGYRKQIESKAQRFAKLYPRLMRGALIAGIIVPIILAVTFSLTDGTKLVALATWIAWILIIIAYLMVVEYIRDSLHRQLELTSLNEQSLRSMLFTSSSAGRTGWRSKLMNAVQSSAGSAEADDELSEEEADHIDDLADTLDIHPDDVHRHIALHHGRHNSRSQS